MVLPNIDFFGKLITFIGLTIMTLCGLYIYNEYNINKQADHGFREQEINLSHKTRQIATSLKISEISYGEIWKQDSILYAAIKKEGMNRTLLDKFNEIDKQLKSLDKTYIRDNALISSEMDSLKLIETLNKAIKNEKDALYSDKVYSCACLFSIGFLITILGLFMWEQKELNERIIAIRQNLDKPTYSIRCQSCSKLFNSFIIYGTESNGNKNYHYCIHCYKNGLFEQPEITISEMRGIISQNLSMHGDDDKAIKKAQKRLLSLDRWKTNNYE